MDGLTGDSARFIDEIEGDLKDSRAAKLLRAEILLDRGETESALELVDPIEDFDGEERLLALGVHGQAYMESGRLEKAGECLDSGVSTVFSNLRSLSKREDKESYLAKHKRIFKAYRSFLDLSGRNEDAENLESDLARVRTAPRVASGVATLSGLSSIACSGVAAAILVWQMIQVSRFEGDVAMMRWAGILAFVGIYLAIAGLLNRRFRKVLPLLGGGIGAVTLLVLMVFFGTLVITRRGLFRETLEYDLDGDGRVDRIVVFLEGVRSEEVQDTDFDGLMDRWVLYRDGKPWKERLDRDGDGYADVEQELRDP